MLLRCDSLLTARDQVESPWLASSALSEYPSDGPRFQVRHDRVKGPARLILHPQIMRRAACRLVSIGIWLARTGRKRAQK